MRNINKRSSAVKLSKPICCGSGAFFGGNYAHHNTEFKSDFGAKGQNQNLVFPLDFDSEFVPMSGDILKHTSYGQGFVGSRMPVTFQCSAIGDRTLPRIYASHDLEAYSKERGEPLRHKVVGENDRLVPLEYFSEVVENNVEYWYDEDSLEADLPIFTIALYCHFAVADVPIAGTGRFFEWFREAFLTKRFQQKRRLTSGKGTSTRLPAFMAIDGIAFRVSLIVVDTSGLHGQAGYKDLAKSTGVELDSKDRIGKDISKMDEVYFDRPDDYDDYSLGDLLISDVLTKNADLVRGMYDSLNVPEYFRLPRLTIGATVGDLLLALIAKKFGVDPEEVRSGKGRREFLRKINPDANSDELIRRHDDGKYLGKIDGGLCRSNACNRATISGRLADVDIGGAYASAMSRLDYGVGRPRIFIPTARTMLSTWLGNNRRQLSSGMWVVRFSTIAPLEFEQDLFLSFDGEAYEVIQKTGEDGFERLLNLQTASSRLATRDVDRGVMTATLRDIVDNVWTPKQRDDFYSKTRIDSLIWYRLDDEVSPDKYWEIANDPNRTEATRHTWARLPFGDLVVDQLRERRSQYPKGTPENTLYKLFANTSYGCSVSPLIATSNAILGANVTAHVRGAMWLVEKGANLVGAITDGQLSDLDRVLYPPARGRIRTEYLARLYRLTRRELRDLKPARLAPLPPTPTKQSIDTALVKHLGELFGDRDALRGLLIETKAKVESASLHGSANYQFQTIDDEGRPTDVVTKMRSYESRKDQIAYTLNLRGDLVALATYEGSNPAAVFLESVRSDPRRVPLPPPFIKYAILKVGDFVNNSKIWRGTSLTVGDSYPTARLLRPATIAGFKFQTLNQRLSFLKAYEKLKRKYGYTFELFFLNDDGTLDLLAMIQRLDDMITGGCIDPMKELNESRNLARDVDASPRFDILKRNCNTMYALRRLISEIGLPLDDYVDEVNFAYTDD